jgi:spore germination cell wall hydrolase CwlJ-like protein
MEGDGNVSKSTNKNKRETRAQQKLVEARRKFDLAQGEFAVVRDHGNELLEKTKARTERALAKASARLEKRSRALARAEDRALSVTSPKAREQAIGNVASNGVASPSSPEAAADVVQQVQVEHDMAHGHSGLIVPADGL